MVAAVPSDVDEASVISVVFDDGVLRNAEAILILVGAIGQLEDLVGTFATQGTLTGLVNADGGT